MWINTTKIYIFTYFHILPIIEQIQGAEEKLNILFIKNNIYLHVIDI